MAKKQYDFSAFDKEVEKEEPVKKEYDFSAFDKEVKADAPTEEPVKKKEESFELPEMPSSGESQYVSPEDEIMDKQLAESRGKAQADMEKEKKRQAQNIRDEYVGLGESALYSDLNYYEQSKRAKNGEPTDFAWSSEKLKIIEDAKNQVVKNGSAEYSINSRFARLKGIDPEITASEGREVIFKDMFDFVQKNALSKQQQEVYKAMGATNDARKSYLENKNSDNLRAWEQNDAVLKELQGDDFKYLYKDGELVDENWNEGDVKEVQAKTAGYQKMSLDKLFDLFGEATAKYQYLNKVTGKVDQGFNDEASPVDRKNALDNLDRIKPMELEARKNLQALANAVMLKQDPASVEKIWYDMFTHGLSQTLDMTLNEPITTNYDLISRYNDIVLSNGGNITEKQFENSIVGIGHKALMGLGSSLPVMADLAITTAVTRGIGSLPVISKNLAAIKKFATAKYGKLGGALADIVGQSARGAVEFSAAGNQNITALMGGAEGAVQGIFDNFQVKGLNVGKFTKWLFRIASGATAETVAEVTGEIVNTSAENNISISEAFKLNYGSTGDEIRDNLLATYMTCLAFSSMSSTISALKSSTNDPITLGIMAKMDKDAETVVSDKQARAEIKDAPEQPDLYVTKETEDVVNTIAAGEEVTVEEKEAAITDIDNKIKLAEESKPVLGDQVDPYVEGLEQRKKVIKGEATEEVIQDAPSYTIEDTEATKEQVVEKIEAAEKVEDLNGVSFTNDPELDTMVNEKFPQKAESVTEPVQEKVVEKKVEVEPVKEIVTNIYTNTPNINDIGTIGEYENYVSKIFPKTKFTEAVYHGGIKDIDVFSNEKQVGKRGTFHFTTNKEDSQRYADVVPLKGASKGKEGSVYSVILDVKNPKYSTEKGEVDGASKADYPNNDAIIGEGYTTEKEIVVFNPDQIHILGSNADITSFKEFQKAKTDISTQPLAAKKTEASISAPTEFDRNKKAEEKVKEKLKKIGDMFVSKTGEIKKTIPTKIQAKNLQMKEFQIMLKNVNKELKGKGFTDKELEKLVELSSETTARLSAGKRNEFDRIAQFDKVSTKFLDAMDKVLFRAEKRKNIETKKRIVKSVSASAKSMAKVDPSMKKRGSKRYDPDTIAYFETLNKLLKPPVKTKKSVELSTKLDEDRRAYKKNPTPELLNKIEQTKGEMLIEKDLAVTERISNTRNKALNDISRFDKGSRAYDKAMSVLAATEGVVEFNQKTTAELEEMEQMLNEIKIGARELQKIKQSSKAASQAVIQQEITDSVDPGLIPRNSVEAAKLTEAKRGINTKKDVDANGKEAANKTMAAIGMDTKEKLKKGWMKFISKSFSLKTILFLHDSSATTVDNSKLVKNGVDPLEKGLKNEKAGVSKKTGEIHSIINKMFFPEQTYDYSTTEGARKLTTMAKRLMFENWRNADNGVVLRVNNEDGSTSDVKILKDDAMRLYAWSKNSALADEMSRNSGINAETVEYLKQQIGEKEVQFVDIMVDNFLDDYYHEINEVYAKTYGIDLPRNEFYFPVERRGYFPEDIKIDIENASPSQALNSFFHSALKSRTHTSKELVISDSNKEYSFMGMIDKHIENMEHFKALAEPANQVSKFMENQSLIAALDQSGMYRPTINMIMDILGVSNKKPERNILDKLLNWHAKATLSLKANMVLKQFSSLVNAYTEYNTGKGGVGKNTLGFVSDVSYLMARPDKAKAVFRDFYANSPAFRHRADTFYESNVDFQTLSRTGAFKTKGKSKFGVKAKVDQVLEVMNKVLMAPIKYGDQFAIIYGYGAIYMNEKRKGTPMNEIIDIVEKYEETQQAKSPVHQSMAQLSGNTADRLLTMYKSSPLQYFNQSVLAGKSIAKSIANGKVPEKKELKRFIINYSISNMAFQAAASLPRLVMGGVTDEDYWSDIKRAGLLGPLNGIVFAGQMVEWLYDTATGRDTYGYNFGVDVSRNINKLFKSITSDKDVEEKIIEGASMLLTTTGLPVENAKQIFEGLEELGDGDIASGTMKAMGYTDYAIDKESSKKKSNKKAFGNVKGL